MNAQWIGHHPWSMLIGPAYGIAIVCITMFFISRVGGWAALTRRFRTADAFCGEMWNWQSARFRWGCNYNNCLTFGANHESLYLSAILLLRPFHPPLLIPWQEIEIETGKTFLSFYDTLRLRIGTEERITLRIYGKLVNRLRQAAGPGWPLYHIEQLESHPHA